MSAPCAWPGKECQDRARRAACIAKVEMISARIIEIDRALDQTQPKQSDIEIQVALWVTGDGGDVMKTSDFLFHEVTRNSLRFQLAKAFGVNIPQRHRQDNSIASARPAERTQSRDARSGARACLHGGSVSCRSRA